MVLPIIFPSGINLVFFTPKLKFKGPSDASKTFWRGLLSALLDWYFTYCEYPFKTSGSNQH